MCREAKDQRMLDDAMFVRGTFTEDGFSDWNHAIQRSKGHETSNCHLCAVRKTAFVAASQNVASSRSKAKRDKTLMVRGALRRIITSLAFLAKEGLAI